MKETENPPEDNINAQEIPESNSSTQQDLENELKEHKEKYLRSLAEIENTRKRMQKERQDMTKFAVDNVLCDLLDPLDNFEKALSFAEKMSDEVKNWATGFQMILTQLKNVLDQHGVKPFEALGKPFDPHLHEAIEVEETLEHKEDTVIEVFIQGYLSGERTLRPARVKVAKSPKKELKQDDNNE